MTRWNLLLLGTVLTNILSKAVMAASPVVMQFTLPYGQHAFGAWFGVPVMVGDQSFNLSVSTALTRTWIPGEALCAGGNVTECTLLLGGMWTGDVPGSVKVEDELLAGVYNKTLAPNLTVDQKLLGQEGVGGVITEAITLEAGTGDLEMDSQSVGVIREGDRERMANGYLSLQQMALSLYSSGSTPSPTFHLYHGAPAYASDAVLELEGLDSGRYLLIFGGYDSALMDLNTTQQYPLVKTNIKPGENDKDDEPSTTAPLPASQDVGYRMEVTLEKLVYRWTTGGRTDNSLISKPTLAIVDSTTPYLWLPKSAIDALVKASGATWNETIGAYTTPSVCGVCSEDQQNSQAAVMDFTFEQTEGVPVTVRFPYYMRAVYLPYDWWTEVQTDVVLVKELPEGSPIILGRAFLSAVHLWVDYGERWFAMKEAYQGEELQLVSAVVPWDRGSHPPITNSSVLLVNPPSTESPDSSPSSSSSSSDSSSKSLTTGAIAGISVGAIAAIIALAAGIFFYRRRDNLQRSSRQSLAEHELDNTWIMRKNPPELTSDEGRAEVYGENFIKANEIGGTSLNEAPGDHPRYPDNKSAVEMGPGYNYLPQPPAAYSPLAGPGYDPNAQYYSQQVHEMGGSGPGPGQYRV